MAIICEATCDNCGATVDPRTSKITSTRIIYGPAVDGITRTERDSLVLDTQWTFASACPSCGAVDWSITGVTRNFGDKR